MLLPSPYRRVRPAISAIALIVTTALLVGMIVFTEFQYPLGDILAGILVALRPRSRLGQPGRSRGGAAAGEAQDMHEKLAQEVKRREAPKPCWWGASRACSCRTTCHHGRLRRPGGVYRYHNRASGRVCD